MKHTIHQSLQVLPTITDKQTDILLNLYKFRFLHTNQFQKLFRHKKPQTVQAWLKDLKDKHYISAHEFNGNRFIVRTKPAIYSLTTQARTKLKRNPLCTIEELNRIYQSKSVSDGFIFKCLFLADIYLNLVAQREEHEKFHFSTRTDLRGFEYFPDPLPDAFIALKKQAKTNRYFLFLLDVRLPWKVLDRRINKYIGYARYNSWAKITRDPLPAFLMICPNETTMKHVHYIIRKNLPYKPFYLTTRNDIRKSGLKGNVWQKVEIPD